MSAIAVYNSYVVAPIAWPSGDCSAKANDFGHVERRTTSRPEDWVFASPQKKGTQPYWPGSLYRAHLKPALDKAGSTKKVGWHTLRHTFGTLMKANGEDIKTMQELLRHATYKVTADVYTQAVTPMKRQAQSGVVRTILPVRTAARGA